MSEREERCENCKFWFRLNAYGHCRRYPPIPSMYADSDGRGSYVGIAETNWPETSVGQWCGEYSPQDTEEVAK